MNPKLSILEQAALLSGQSHWESRALPRHGIDAFWMADGPHGIRRQVGSSDHLGLNPSRQATCFPTAATLANSWDPELIEQVGRALGIEASCMDVDVLLGPGLNIKRSPLAGRNFEYYSEDPYLAGKLAAALVRGIQSAGVAASPKHFAANSQETRRMASDSIVDDRTLREIYLTGFEIAVREGRPRAVMSSYNLVNGTYAHENEHLLTDILRSEWGFDGMVVTDWGGGNDPVAGAAAGGSLEMPGPNWDSTRQLLNAVSDGRLAPRQLSDRSSEVQNMARDAGQRVRQRDFDLDAHHALARRVAEESMVLLRNEHAVLPLPAGATVAVIGDMAETPRYQGAGSSLVNPTRLSTGLHAIKASTLNSVGFARGYRRNAAPDEALVAEAVELAQQADVVIAFCGLDETSESEGVDRARIDLPEAQTDLIRALAAANPQLVVVLCAGSVVATDWVEQTAAVLHSYLGGQAGAEAVVRTLTGAVNPSGKLAETYPFKLADTPTAGNFPATGQYSYYREGLFVGYRHYDSAGIPARFPFGFGLSYTSFDYSDLLVDELGVEFTVTNAGEVPGAEVAQLYVSRPGSRLVRPTKELKGFAKVHLDAGESRRVRLNFDRYTWRHFDAVSQTWQTEGGRWQLLVGANSADIRLTGELAVQGVDPVPQAGLTAYRSGDVRRVSDADFAELLGRELPREPGLGAARIELTANSPLLELRRARNPIARLGFRMLDARRRKAETAGMPDLNILFVFNMPFRAIAKMSNGQVDKAMVEGIVDVANGRVGRGMAAIVRGYFANRRDNKRVAEMLSQQGA